MKKRDTGAAVVRAYERCARIADKYNKGDVSPGIQTGVAIAGAAIAKEIRVEAHDIARHAARRKVGARGAGRGGK